MLVVSLKSGQDMRKVLPSFQVSSNVLSSNPLLWLLHPSPIFQSTFHSYCRHPIAPYLNLDKDLHATAQKGTLPPLPQNGLSFTLPKPTVHHHTTFPFLPILPAFHLLPINHPYHSHEPRMEKPTTDTNELVDYNEEEDVQLAVAPAPETEDTSAK